LRVDFLLVRLLVRVDPDFEDPADFEDRVEFLGFEDLADLRVDLVDFDFRAEVFFEVLRELLSDFLAITFLTNRMGPEPRVSLRAASISCAQGAVKGSRRCPAKR